MVRANMFLLSASIGMWKNGASNFGDMTTFGRKETCVNCGCDRSNGNPPIYKRGDK